jgi:dTDP-3-amino-2,3,6-trideoxy-4-keto-D-glucose/dTDP-3-amino-3,4,6-trideoxy-alpha-D-glucose/dTDP-2,6-dideoxy-D-kanosamine transaminase
MKINVWSYLEEYKLLKKEILREVDRVFSSGKLILGPKVQLFEQQFSNFLKLKHGISVNSGTDAIQIALMSAKIGAGDEVITVSNTAVPTVSAIVSTGAKPVFVDINKSDYLINVDEIEKKITKKTKAIIPVNLYGQCADYQSINKIAKKYNLLVLEDCAQSTGAYYKKKPSGSLGDISAFSFYPTKVLGGYGDGGMITTSNKLLADRALRLRKYGMNKLYYSEEHGINSRLDEIHAAILSLKLKKIKTWVNKRRQIAKIYNKYLKNTSLVLPTENKDNYHSYYVYVVRHKKRAFIMKELKKNNIFCNISYPFPIHTMKGYSYLNYKKGDFPITESLSKKIFSLPMYPLLKKKEILKVIKILTKLKL